MCPAKLSTEQFINRAHDIHGNTYDYTITEYQGSTKPIIINCKQHGPFTLQQASTHLKSPKHGTCPLCRYQQNSFNSVGNTEEFIRKANQVHNNRFDYSKVVYVSAHTKVTIKCKEHGYFKQRPNDHLSGYGCCKCRPNNSLTKEQFLERARKAHGTNPRYDYSKVEYVNRVTPVEIICPKHGSFKQKPEHHFRGSGCPKCKMSKGESKILGILTGLNVEFVYQKTFDDCISDKGRHLRFDFFLPNYNILIEFDGEQHKGRKPPFWDQHNQERLKQHDELKNLYAKNNGLKMIRLTSKELKNVDQILWELIQQ